MSELEQQTAPIRYKGFSIVEDYRNPYSNKPEFMYYPTSQGIQHDGDCVDGQMVYCGNCTWCDSLESAKDEIDETEII